MKAKELNIQSVDLIAKLEELEERLCVIEELTKSFPANFRITCKVCETVIDDKNTSNNGLLAELCDKCWDLQDCTL